MRRVNVGVTDEWFLARSGLALSVNIGRSECGMEPDSFNVMRQELILDRVEALAETAAGSEVRTRR